MYDLDGVIDPRRTRRPLLIKQGRFRKDWTEGFSEKEQDGYGPAQALGPRAGCMYQLYIAIKNKKEDKHHKHVGTITVGFRKKPDRKKVDPYNNEALGQRGRRLRLRKVFKENFLTSEARLLT